MLGRRNQRLNVTYNIVSYWCQGLSDLQVSEFQIIFLCFLEPLESQFLGFQNGHFLANFLDIYVNQNTINNFA